MLIRSGATGCSYRSLPGRVTGATWFFFLNVVGKRQNFFSENPKSQPSSPCRKKPNHALTVEASQSLCVLLNAIFIWKVRITGSTEEWSSSRGCLWSWRMWNAVSESSDAERKAPQTTVSATWETGNCPQVSIHPAAFPARVKCSWLQLCCQRNLKSSI